jgi:hypothetical protein
MVLQEISEICGHKVAHILENWQETRGVRTMTMLTAFLVGAVLGPLGVIIVIMMDYHEAKQSGELDSYAERERRKAFMEPPNGEPPRGYLTGAGFGLKENEWRCMTCDQVNKHAVDCPYKSETSPPRRWR